ncbi:hypothetical protein [Deinococcus planocerae]|uniref:hypothetical protein n=1 Tax=Deinococcus planocerae TaxID=1737569 RepID=UPI000C7E8C6E|nr:hypothetical protein [Deinococcus planocerae]
MMAGPVRADHPDAANRRHDHHKSLIAAEAGYGFTFAMLPGGQLPVSLSINRALLRKVSRELRPFRDKWTAPDRHLTKHYRPFKARIDDLYDCLVADFEDLLDLAATIALGDPAVLRLKRALTELQQEAARRSETKYYALPILFLYTYEIALMASQVPGHSLPAQILSDLSAFLVYPNDDANSFELRGVYHGAITDAGQEHSWHVLVAVRLGRSQLYRCPQGTEQQALYLQGPRSVTTYQRRQHPLTPLAGETCRLILI